MPGLSLTAAVAAVAVTLAALAPVAAAVVPAEPTTSASPPAAARTGADLRRDAARHPSRPAAAVSAPAPPPAAAAPSTVGPVTGRTATVARPGRGWQWPLLPAPAVVRRFDVGPFRWSPGHRGVDLAPTTGVGAGAVVRAAGPGVVRFAGAVAGRPVVSVDHGGGLRTTYEPVDPAVRPGDVVPAGAVLGTLASTASHCAPAACLHWGAVLDGRYIDPLILLRPREPPVLLPLQ